MPARGKLVAREGFRSLFDPMYVPPRVIGREKERSLLEGFLGDHVSMLLPAGGNKRAFGCSVLIHGLGGIGKFTLALKAMCEFDQRLQDSRVKIQNIAINCQEKNENIILEEFFYGLLEKNGVEPREGVPESGPPTWDIIYRVKRRQQDTVHTMLLANIEKIHPGFLHKIARHCKNLGINLILTSRAGFIHQFAELADISLVLDTYRPSDLEEIVDQRRNLALPNTEHELTEFITDAILEQDTARPGPCIGVLRHLYPVLVHDVAPLELELLQACIRENLPSMRYSEFELVDFLSNAPFQELLFLDNITSYLLGGNVFYMTGKKLEELYTMACEMMETEPIQLELDTYRMDLLRYNLLLKSTHGNDRYFSLVPPSLLKNYLDETFH